MPRFLSDKRESFQSSDDIGWDAGLGEYELDCGAGYILVGTREFFVVLRQPAHRFVRYFRLFMYT